MLRAAITTRMRLAYTAKRFALIVNSVDSHRMSLALLRPLWFVQRAIYPFKTLPCFSTVMHLTYSDCRSSSEATLVLYISLQQPCPPRQRAISVGVRTHDQIRCEAGSNSQSPFYTWDIRF